MSSPGELPFLDFADPATGPGQWFRDACANVDLEALGGVVVERCLRVFPPEIADVRFAQYLRLSVMENLNSLQGLLCRTIHLYELDLEQPLSFASIQAELHVPQAALQRSYRVSFLTIWDEWSRHLREFGETVGIPCREVDDGLSHLTRAVFTYQDFVTSRAADNYARVESALNRSKARVQQQLIKELLSASGDPLPSHDLLLLEYDVHGHHLAILLSESTDDAIRRISRELRAATMTRQSMTYRLAFDRSVLWLGSPSPWTATAVAAVGQVLRRVGALAAVGDPHQGPTGLVTTYREAEQAEGIRVDGDRSVLQYQEVMLDILLLAQPGLATAFVHRTLGQLAEDTAEAGRLRATMEASFRFGSHVAAAEELHVHEHTVRNRLARVEELLGHSLRDNRTEVEVALRLKRSLGEGPAASAP